MCRSGSIVHRLLWLESDAARMRGRAERVQPGAADVPDFLRFEKKLHDASVALRDHVCVTTQIASLPLGDKERYVAALEAAYGEKIDEHESSLFSQSYTKTIREHFANAYLSNNRRENLNRGSAGLGFRPARTRPKRSPAR